MSIVRGCDVPEHLFYKIEDLVWARLERNGEVTIGYVAPGCVALGQVCSYSPRRIGKAIRKGMSCATLESDGWVEPARSPIAGTVVAVNEVALDDPLVINRDPYGSGWLARLAPEDWQRDSGDLLSGAAAVAAFEVFLARQAAERARA